MACCGKTRAALKRAATKKATRAATRKVHDQQGGVKVTHPKKKKPTKKKAHAQKAKPCRLCKPKKTTAKRPRP